MSARLFGVALVALVHACAAGCGEEIASGGQAKDAESVDDSGASDGAGGGNSSDGALHDGAGNSGASSGSSGGSSGATSGGASSSDGSSGGVDGGTDPEVAEQGQCADQLGALFSLKHAAPGVFPPSPSWGAIAVSLDGQPVIIGGGTPSCTGPSLFCGTPVLLKSATWTLEQDSCLGAAKPKKWHDVEGFYDAAVALYSNGKLALVTGGRTTQPLSGKISLTNAIRVHSSSGQAFTHTLAKQTMQRARADHTITRLEGKDERFLVVGGNGDVVDPFWELWDGDKGILAGGKTARHRTGHRAVLLPGGAAVGHVLLIGGVEDGGLAKGGTYEVLRYDGLNNVASAGSEKITCSVGKTYHGGKDSTAMCATLKGSAGYKEYTFLPIVEDLPAKLPRPHPGVVFTKLGSHHHVHVVGGGGKRYDILNTATGAWVDSGLTLLQRREHALVAASKTAAGAPVVLVAGGFDPATKTLGDAFMVVYPGGYDGGKLQRVKVADPLGAGQRHGGFWTPLAGGKVLLGGGLVPPLSGTLWSEGGLAVWVP